MFFSNLLMSGSTFSPLSLFASGEQGVWYDPNDLSSMWQDAQGTTAVTAVEQAVGLILDRREGRGLGTELVTNNTFATDTGWTKGTDWTIGSGVATKAPGTAAVLSQAISLTAGFTYRLVYTITRSAGAITPQFTGGSTVAGTARSAAGTFVEVLTAVTDNTTLEFSADASFAGTVDNVYVKRVSGNDAWQLTSASRPVLSARVNLLTKTEQFDDAAWTKTALSSATTSATTDPLGGTAARICTLSGGATTHSVTQTASENVTSGTAYTLSIYAKAGTWQYIRLARFGSSFPAPGTWWWNLSNGTFNGSLGTGWSNQSITLVGDGWYRLSVQATPTNTGSDGFGVVPTDNSGGTSPNSDGSTFYLWGADLRVSNDGVGLPAYQRVNTSTDYDTAGFPMYLRFDGTDDSLVTGSINFSGTDKVTSFIAARKLSDAAQMLLELSANFTGVDGGFSNAYDTGPKVTVATRGISNSTYATGEFGIAAAPLTSVISWYINRGLSTDDVVFIRKDGADQILTRGNQNPVGNFGNFPLYIGSRGSASLRYNGRLYSLIVRGAASTAGQISDTEGWVNSRTKAY
jgi:hypothetical protein